ncbi:IMP cyclohydrolase [Paenibacillus lupini]|uniref:IMP cyclohydrolase n=1 Tax=Paenibacillus lupini TaxID=1450204 RepID=UPI001421CC56|nr:IMP cyclohydrolase [Paenibacillus lupini]NIK21809.1 IMP cyclohydrolase [Paenibacillus lupini]
MKTAQTELFDKPYPGRMLITGMTPSGTHYVQVYWIMGRSANSRNRVFEREESSVMNQAFDPAQMEDPSLIIYYPVRHWENMHIVSNGDQTDTIYEGLQHNRTFEQSLVLREFEPDAPHFTPRISVVINTDLKQYALSILKTHDNDPSVCLRHSYSYNNFKRGIGHCIHTYNGEQDGVLKPFEGEPFEVPLFDSINEIADYYWERINKENKISLLVKFIDVSSHDIQFEFRNKLT